MIPYKPFSVHLQQNGLIATPAELQAMAAGVLVMDPECGFETWQQQVIDDYCMEEKHWPSVQSALSALFELTLNQLQADDFSFELLLPDDAVDLSQRLLALSNWCAAFLSSLAAAGLSQVHLQDESVGEFIHDVEKISRVDEHSDGTEGEEADFMELTEYVRAGVMMLHQQTLKLAAPSDRIQ